MIHLTSSGICEDMGQHRTSSVDVNGPVGPRRSHAQIGKLQVLDLESQAERVATGERDRSADPASSPSAELLAELDDVSARMESADPSDILRWASQRFAPKLTMATAFGPEGMVIIHMLAQVAPETFVFNLDSGYQFPETLQMRERVAERYGIQVELKRSELSVEAYERLHRGPLYQRNSDQCCFDRKIQVLRKAILGMDAWISAIRRDQSADRAEAPIVGWDKKFHLVKVNPLATWTSQQVWQMITDHDIPFNPLHDQGYTSIGCWPCTRPVLLGEDERAGRWSGTAKTECGLHSLGDTAD